MQKNPQKNKATTNIFKEFMIQWVFTYGIMMFVVFFQCLFLPKLTLDMMWDAVINAFVPTTITFTGAILIQKVHMLTNNFIALFLFLVIFGLGLLYVCVFAYDGSNRNTVIIIRVGMVILTIISLFLSKSIFGLKDKYNECKHKKEKSDANISRK